MESSFMMKLGVKSFQEVIGSNPLTQFRVESRTESVLRLYEILTPIGRPTS
jgi:hypothetical protein